MQGPNEAKVGTAHPLASAWWQEGQNCTEATQWPAQAAAPATHLPFLSLDTKRPDKSTLSDSSCN